MRCFQDGCALPAECRPAAPFPRGTLPAAIGTKLCVRPFGQRNGFPAPSATPAAPSKIAQDALAPLGPVPLVAPTIKRSCDAMIDEQRTLLRIVRANFYPVGVRSGHLVSFLDVKGDLHCHLLSGGHRRVKALIYCVSPNDVAALFSDLSGGLHAPVR